MDGVTIEIDPIAVAASELLEKRGYDAMTMSDVALRSGFSRQTVYARFRSKAKLLEAVITEFFRVFPAFLLRWEEARAVNGSTTTGEPRFPATLVIAALEEFCSRWGPLARVALSARDLPWLSAHARRSCRELHQLLRYHLAAPELRETLMDLCLDLLKQTALRAGRNALDPRAAEALAAVIVGFCQGLPSAGLRVASDRQR
jgi:AcrR family transcriptional regulator